MTILPFRHDETTRSQLCGDRRHMWESNRVQHNQPKAHDTVTTPLSKKDRKILRHRWHRILFVLSTATSILIFIVALAIGALILGMPGIDEHFSLEEFGKIQNFVFLAILAPFGILILRAVRAAQFSATGAVASEQQFEYVHDIVEHYSRLAGLDRTPSVAIVAGTDFTAKTAFNYGRTMILVHSDLLDAPRPFGTDWGALRFAIAREVAHIAAGHRSALYELCTAVTQAIPFVSHPLTRAEEYTADRYAAVLAADAVGDYFAVMAVSKDNWQGMSLHATVARAGRTPFRQTLAMWTMKTPPSVWRVQALARLGVFLCGTHGNHADGLADYKHFLTMLPTLPITREALRTHHAAFIFAPKPLSAKELERLSPKGTNFERLALYTTP